MSTCLSFATSVIKNAKQEILCYFTGQETIKICNVKGVRVGEQNELSDATVRAKMFKSQSGVWQCLDCQFSGSANKLYQHIENFHVEVSFKCSLCNVDILKRAAFLKHRSRYHTKGKEKRTL